MQTSNMFKSKCALAVFLILLAMVKGDYKAAVVEFHFQPELQKTPPIAIKDRVINMITNIKEAAAQGVQIIVFPEASTTSLDVQSKAKGHLELYMVVLPDEPNFNACLNASLSNSDTYKIIRDLSCAAKDNNIYVVVNVLELGEDKNFYDTVVVLSNSGEFVTKYRKVNMVKRESISKGNSTVTFTTSFGVKFGILSGDDVLFKTPAMDLVKEHNVTDIILTTAYKSSLPFGQALSIQSGYSTTFGVNLLAANLYDQRSQSSGSGIYLANGTSHVYVSNVMRTKLLVQNVSPPRKRQFGCDNGRSKKLLIDNTDQDNNIHDFAYNMENLSAYNHRAVQLTTKQESYEVCSKEGDFCCTFKIQMKDTSKFELNPIYKVIAHDIRDDRYGITDLRNKSCALVPCSANNVSTCGFGAEKSIVFEYISMTVKVNKNDLFIPITLGEKYVPLDNYHYCVNNTPDGHVEIEMKTVSPTVGLNTFGIFGTVTSKSTSVASPLLANLLLTCISVFMVLKNVM